MPSLSEVGHFDRTTEAGCRSQNHDVRTRGPRVSWDGPGARSCSNLWDRPQNLWLHIERHQQSLQVRTRTPSTPCMHAWDEFCKPFWPFHTMQALLFLPGTTTDQAQRQTCYPLPDRGPRPRVPSGLTRRNRGGTSSGRWDRPAPTDKSEANYPNWRHQNPNSPSIARDSVTSMNPYLNGPLPPSLEGPLALLAEGWATLNRLVRCGSRSA